jgi:hypothetical protein
MAHRWDFVVVQMLVLQDKPSLSPGLDLASLLGSPAGLAAHAGEQRAMTALPGNVCVRQRVSSASTSHASTANSHDLADLIVLLFLVNLFFCLFVSFFLLCVCLFI